MFSRLISQLAIASAAVALASCVPDARDGPDGDITVGLTETGDSGQSGTAALIAEGDQTLVVIGVDGDRVAEAQEAQDAHIHEGTCGELSPEPAFELQSTSGGRSATTVDRSLDTLTSGTYAIAVHPSDEVSATHVSCGNVKPAR